MQTHHRRHAVCTCTRHTAGGGDADTPSQTRRVHVHASHRERRTTREREQRVSRERECCTVRSSRRACIRACTLWESLSLGHSAQQSKGVRCVLEEL
jgi:hypothetical protein